jgi:hypothetical protein
MVLVLYYSCQAVSFQHAALCRRLVRTGGLQDVPARTMPLAYILHGDCQHVALPLYCVVQCWRALEWQPAARQCSCVAACWEKQLQQVGPARLSLC